VAFQRRKPAAIGVKAPFPGFIEPALASSIDKVASGERWIHEIKFDGYRVQLHLANEAVRIFTRRVLALCNPFPSVISDTVLGVRYRLGVRSNRTKESRHDDGDMEWGDDRRVGQDDHG
jgi:ATP-dependent DNA ligase